MGETPGAALDRRVPSLLVPMLRVGTPSGTLCVPWRPSGRSNDAERRGQHSHAGAWERGTAIGVVKISEKSRNSSVIGALANLRRKSTSPACTNVSFSMNTPRWLHPDAACAEWDGSAACGGAGRNAGRSRDERKRKTGERGKIDGSQNFHATTLRSVQIILCEGLEAVACSG
jgi:hypothetical protein